MVKYLYLKSGKRKMNGEIKFIKRNDTNIILITYPFVFRRNYGSLVRRQSYLCRNNVKVIWFDKNRSSGSINRIYPRRWSILLSLSNTFLQFIVHDTLNL